LAEAQLDALNTGAPATDRDIHGERVGRIAAARLAGLPDPDGHAAWVAAAFLPDVVLYRPRQPAVFNPGDGNGRVPEDNAFDVAVEILAGSRLANASAPRLATPAFPFLSAPQPAPSCHPSSMILVSARSRPSCGCYAVQPAPRRRGLGAVTYA
jgi:hypothetical protein